MKTLINFPYEHLCTFKDLAEGDMFVLKHNAEFVGIKINPAATSERFDALVLANTVGQGYTKVGKFTHVLHDTVVQVVKQVTYDVK